MSFICRNGPEHRHETREQARTCWGFATPTDAARSILSGPLDPTPPPPLLPPTAVHSPAQSRPATGAQIKYATDLGGDPGRIARCDFYSISSYIDELKRGGAKVTSAPIVDPKLEFAKSMLTSLQSGYYAVRTDPTTDDIFFMRVSRPKSGTKKDALQVQSMHGTAAAKPSLMEALVVWPSNRYTFFGRYLQDHWRTRLVDSIMLLVTDPIGAARLYADKIGRCCRCNAALTDERSRHYGIGPECEKYWPHIIEAVDSQEVR